MSNQPIQITDAQFEAQVLRSEIPVLVDFWAPWCGPCRMVAPVLEELAEELAGRVAIAKVNTDQSQTEALRHGVRGIPTMILFHRGREIDRQVGALPKGPLKSWIESALGNGAGVSA